jgi:RNA polymerase sigma-70 factor (ECF subfamily)
VKALSLTPPPKPATEAAAAALVADALLFRGLRARSAEALDQVCAQHGDGLRRIAWLMLGDPQAADDAAQDALIAAWDGARRAEEETRLRPWLAGITVNLCRAELRKRARRRRRETRAARDEVQSDSPEAERRERDARLLAAVQRLEPDLREMVALRFLHGMPVAECAVVLGIPAGTVKSRTHGAMQRLRELLPELESLE